MFWWLLNVTAWVPLHVFNWKRFPLSQEPASGKFSHSESNEELYHQITLLMFMVPIFRSWECLLNHNWVVPNNSQFYFGLIAWHTVRLKSKDSEKVFNGLVSEQNFSVLPGKEEGCILALFEELCNYALCFAVFELNRHHSVYNSPGAILISVLLA